MKTLRSLVLSVLLIVGIATTSLSIFVEPAAAAPGSKDFANQLVFDADDDPVLNDDPATAGTFGGFSIAHGSEGGQSQTTSDSNLNQIYTWRLPELTDSICTNAQLTSLHITANVTADTEGDPDLSALMVYRIDGSDQYNIGNYTVQQGVDYATSTGGFTPPGGDGIYGAVRGSDPVFGAQLTGQLEATWDLSSYDPADQFGIMVQQDSQDGSVNLQTTLQNVELTYDDANCVVDGSITKTLLNPSSVHPGGQATYEITVTNKGNEPLPFNAQEDRGIYDVASPSLTYVGVTSDNVDIACSDYGTVSSAFGEGGVEPYQNHLDYHMILCASQSSMPIQPGESLSYQMSFTVAPNATNITNFVSWILQFGDGFPSDPDMAALDAAAGTLEPGGVDMLDLILSGQLSADLISWSSYDFPTDSTTTQSENNDTLADTGRNIRQTLFLGLIVVLSAGATLRYYSTRRNQYSLK